MEIEHDEHWSPAIGELRTVFYFRLPSGRHLPLGEVVFSRELCPDKDEAIRKHAAWLADLLEELRKP